MTSRADSNGPGITVRRRRSSPNGVMAGTAMSGIALGGLAGAVVAGPAGSMVGMVVGGAAGAALERQFPSSSENGTTPHES